MRAAKHHRTDSYPSAPRPGEITLKSADEIAALRRAGRVAALALDAAVHACVSGVTTAELNSVASKEILRHGATPLFRGYKQGSSPAYPADSCISVNEEVVHGVPGARRLSPGDVVSIDLGIGLDGWCADAATTFVLPLEHPEWCDHATRERFERVSRMVGDTRGLLTLAARRLRPGARWSEIALELERRAIELGYAIVTEYVGHGIGRELHEPPRVPAYRTGFVGEDFIVQPGMVLAVEPMLALSSREPSAEGFRKARVRLLKDGWTVVTADGAPACHEEHMVAITEEGATILTLP